MVNTLVYDHPSLIRNPAFGYRSRLEKPETVWQPDFAGGMPRSFSCVRLPPHSQT
jgi:hypothetical protein